MKETEYGNLSGQSVLVTGASGFIGTGLTQRLRLLGARVYAVSRKKHAPSSIQWLCSDLSDPGAAKSLFDQVKPDVVYHLASRVTSARDSDLVVPLFRDNLASTVYLLEAAHQRRNCRFILAGSQEEPRGEEFPLSPYAASKGAAYQYLRLFNECYGLPTVHLRTFMVYGPGQGDLGKLVPYVILETLAGRSPLIWNSSRLVDWIYIQDVVDAYVLAATREAAIGQSVDIGTGKLTSVAEVVGAIAAHTGFRGVLEFEEESGRTLSLSRKASLESGMKYLQWAPETDVETGLANTVAWYRALNNTSKQSECHAGS